MTDETVIETDDLVDKVNPDLIDSELNEADGSEVEHSGLASITLVRNNADTEHRFDVVVPAVIGRFDPDIGPIEIDLGSIGAESAYISRKHAKIIFEGDRYKIVDLESSNGTFLFRDDDYQRVDEAELSSGDLFSLGNAKFRFDVQP
jgi:pSer/pThr/pTyr-binding forkhead associated (FHA) protein